MSNSGELPARSRSSSETETSEQLTLDQLLTSEQVADLLAMRRSTVEEYARRGLLPSIKLGRHRRFVRADIESALKALRDRGHAA